MSLLSVYGLTKVYGGLTAAQDVVMDIPQGQIRALIGPNGAGKSTTVGMISGRIPATSGLVRFDGRDISRLPAHKRIQAGMSYTFQITSVFGRLTALENVALAVQGNTARAREALGRVGLEGEAEQIAGDLSYGHQRLLEIAMGLAPAPKLLILDEPTQGLTDPEIEGFNALIRSLAPATTILLIEHNMSVVMALAEQVTVLDMGQVLAEGTPKEIRANTAVQAAYLGKAP